MNASVKKLLDEAALPAVCERCGVRTRSLCGVLNPEELHAVNSISRLKTVETGQIVVMEGDHDLFATVVSGILLVKKGLEDGREQIINILFPSDFTGRAFVRDASFTVEAASDAVLCTFERAGFEQAVDTYPAIERKLFELTLAELDQARDWMLLLGQKDATERVATFLVRLANRTGCAAAGSEGKENAPIAFDLPITRSDVASTLGLTIETVSRKLTSLRKAGIIEIKSTRHVTVLDPARLRAAAGYGEESGW